jgi:4-hydroxy-tetrahydrodipicolinate synthase
MQFLSGTGVAVVTPFTVEHHVDHAALRGIIDHLIAGGVEYLVALGTTGESATLNAEEQKAVIETFVAHCEGRIPLVLGAGGNDTRAICAKVNAYTQAYRPAAILSVSPAYNKPTQEGIYQHYRAVAASTDLPLILYNVPGRTASNVAAETTLRLAHDCANVVAVKEASTNLDQCMRIMANKPADFQLISGDDPTTLPLIALGASGVISVTANALPQAFSQMVRAALSQDLVEARRLQYHLLPAMTLNFAEGNPAGVKQLMALQGLCTPEVRLPLVKCSADLRERMRQLLAQQGVNVAG